MALIAAILWTVKVACPNLAVVVDFAAISFVQETLGPEIRVGICIMSLVIGMTRTSFNYVITAFLITASTYYYVVRTISLSAHRLVVMCKCWALVEILYSYKISFNL